MKHDWSAGMGCLPYGVVDTPNDGKSHVLLVLLPMLIDSPAAIASFGPITYWRKLLDLAPMGDRRVLWTDPSNWMNQVVLAGPSYRYRLVGERDGPSIADSFS